MQPPAHSESPSESARPVVHGVVSFSEASFLTAAALMIFGSGWLLGARYPWSQWTLLVLGGLLVLTGGALYLERSRAKRIGCRDWSGWKFVVIASVGFLAFVAIQSFNIFALPQFSENYCRLIPRDFLAWLPSSVGGPFDGLANGMFPTENAARQLLVYGAAVCGAVGLALGVQAASTLRRIVQIMLIHATISALICIVHQASGSTKVLWLEGDPFQFLGAPFFFYKNQNAAYQVLLCAWALHWCAENLTTRPKTSAVLALINVAGAMSIRSRAGLLFAAVLLLIWLWQIRPYWRGPISARPIRTTFIAITAAVMLGAAVWSSGGGKTLNRFEPTAPSISYVIHGDTYRRLLHEIALEMFVDRPWYGWGGAAYRYLYATYESSVPEMAQHRTGNSYYLLLGHADGDWYEFLVEFGVIGTGLFLLIWLPQLWLWIRMGWPKEAILPATAVALLLYHGLIDQTFRNLGVIFLLLASAMLTTKAVLLLPAKSSRPHRKSAR